MLVSKMFFPTMKETPSEAGVTSASLMLRAALTRKLSSGLYTYLPLGLRALRKIMEIIREEMNKAGGQEFMFPILLPKELLIPSGRWDTFRKELFRLKDRHEIEHALGPTHEEAFTDVVKNEIQSYKQLPLNLYQMHTKFRDEIRPRFGVIRSREFIMKDAYSFHINEECLNNTYKVMSETYSKIFKRMGLDTVSVKADSGAMGGSGSEEFMVLSEVGEEEIAFCTSCGYRANVEKATCAMEEDVVENSSLPMDKVDTPNIKTIEDLEKFFSCSAKEFIKTIIYKTESKENIAVLIRGDLDINETKLSNYLGGEEIELADEETVLKVTGAKIGFAGPVMVEARIIADNSIKTMGSAITGACENDKHFKNVLLNRDFTVEEFTDIRTVKNGDKCEKCGSKLSIKHGLELGHVFKLGSKYSEAMKVRVLNNENKEVTPVMGCYGIGVNRTLAAVLEQHHDDKGIIFPITVAPYEAVVISLEKQGEAYDVAFDIYKRLNEAGVETMFDERNERPGVKFADIDLVGIPIRIVVGKRGFENGEAEFKLRKEGESENIKLESIVDRVIKAKEKLFEELEA